MTFSHVLLLGFAVWFVQTPLLSQNNRDSLQEIPSTLTEPKKEPITPRNPYQRCVENCHNSYTKLCKRSSGNASTTLAFRRCMQKQCLDSCKK